jgi:small subunit ribosomal protein S8
MSLQSTDPIADMLTRIRNAALVGKGVIRMPSSKIKETVARELKKAGYLEDVSIEKATPRDTLIITMSTGEKSSNINSISRISKPGRRVYAKTTELPHVKNGRGMILISTSKGVMSDREARKAKLGGELICKVY